MVQRSATNEAGASQDGVVWQSPPTAEDGAPVLDWFACLGTSLDMVPYFVRLLDAIPDAAYIKDTALRYIYINSAGAAAAGMLPKEILGKTDPEIFDRKTAESMLLTDRRAMSADAPIAVDESVTDNYGNTRHYRSTKCAIRDSGGKLLGLYGISSDLTERRELLGALTERLKEKQSLYNVIRCLSQVEVAFESRLAQVVAFLPPGWQFPERTHARLTFDGEMYTTTGYIHSPKTISSTIKRFDTTVGILEVSISGSEPWGPGELFLPEEKELLDHVACAIGEAAERKRLEDQYAQSQKMDSIGRLAGAVAHDFNNILSIVIGHSESILPALEPGSTLHEGMTEICIAAERAAALNRQLLTFSRQDTAKPIVIDLNACVSDIIKMLSRLLPADKELTSTLSPDPVKIRIDPVQCHQILTNLVVNARDAIPGCGRITIETGARTLDRAYCVKNGEFEPGDYALLSVSDTGTGISRELQSKIFEPFFTTKPEGKGTGLGLATVYGIVKQNSGFIQVYSEIGKGTTFSVFFPRRSDDAWQKPTVLSPNSIVRGTETVLLVEDDPQILQLQEKSISRLGYTVLSAGTPERALQISANHTGAIELLISDMIMPEMNGYELFQALVALRPNLRCLFTSGYPANVISERCEAGDDIQFLQKPFSRQALAEKIRETLR